MNLKDQYKRDGFEGERYFVLPQAGRVFLSGHALCRQLYFTDIGYFPFARGHYRFRSKGSMEYILIFCVWGEGWYEQGGERHSIQAGQFFILSPGKPHQYGTNEYHPWTIYWVHFQGDSAGYFYRYLMEGKVAVSAPNQENRISWFEEMLQQLEIATPKSLVYACGCLYAFLASFQNTITHPVKEPDRIAGSIGFMKKNLHRRLSLATLAREAGLSSSHYAALFRSKMQIAPIQYFNFLKIQEACYLLQRTGRQVKDIAGSLGFNDPYYFSRLFRQVMGVSPKVYRKQWR